jgi:hypothetical protein
MPTPSGCAGDPKSVTGSLGGNSSSSASQGAKQTLNKSGEPRKKPPPMTAEHKAKISSVMKGKQKSLSHKLAISQGRQRCILNRGYSVTPVKGKASK